MILWPRVRPTAPHLGSGLKTLEPRIWRSQAPYNKSIRRVFEWLMQGVLHHLHQQLGWEPGDKELHEWVKEQPRPAEQHHTGSSHRLLHWGCEDGNMRHEYLTPTNNQTGQSRQISAYAPVNVPEPVYVTRPIFWEADAGLYVKLWPVFIQPPSFKPTCDSSWGDLYNNCTFPDCRTFHLSFAFFYIPSLLGVE